MSKLWQWAVALVCKIFKTAKKDLDRDAQKEVVILALDAAAAYLSAWSAANPWCTRVVLWSMHANRGCRECHIVYETLVRLQVGLHPIFNRSLTMENFVAKIEKTRNEIKAIK